MLEILAAGLIFKPILEELVTDSVKDYVKDFFKDCLGKVVRLPKRDILKGNESVFATGTRGVRR